MLHPLIADAGEAAIPVIVQRPGEEVPDSLSDAARAFLAASGYKPKSGKTALAPSASGGIEAALICLDETDRLGFGKLATALPAATYAMPEGLADPELAALAFLMSGYRFTRYKSAANGLPRLRLPPGLDAERLSIIAAATEMARDLINTPTCDLPPEALGEAALSLAARHGASSRIIVGDALLDENYPMVHAVGRAAGQASLRQQPRLVDFTHGPEDGLRVTLIGKGVCFDTGGLNIKPESGMLLMKKDMGGAAVALAAAEMIMALGLKVRLRVILPIVENAISGDAFRPGDILKSRKGLSVEIGNTDAEGRLILADALALAGEDPPDLLINYATLTGAARVALGPDLPASFFNDEALAADMLAAGERVADPVWRLPLHKPYDSMLDSPIADVNHIASGGMAGSIVAALFLQRFVPANTPWAHIDTFAWRTTALPGRPAGGEPQTARLTLEMIERRLGRRL